MSSLIRISTALCSFATPRSFSQLVTSFFGVWCQGIHLMLLVAWSIFFLFSVLKSLSTFLSTNRNILLSILYYLLAFNISYLSFFRLLLSKYVMQLSMYKFQAKALVVEIRGFEPLAYTLRTYRSTNWAISPHGGLKWTRTTDLTLIRRVL